MEEKRHVSESGNLQGRHHTLEARAKMSKAQKGRVKSPEWRAKIGEANKRRIWTPESKAKMSLAKKGKTPSPETKAKLSAAKKGEKNSFYGKHPTEETKQKLREAHKKQIGENHPMWGKHHSLETKAKIAAAHKGKKRSPESIAKQRATCEEKRMRKEMRGEEHNPVVKKTVGLIQGGGKNSWLGRHHTEESKQKIKQNRRSYVGENHPMWGKHHTPEARRNMSLGQKGRKEPWQEATPKIPKVKEIVQREGESEAEFKWRLRLSQSMKGKPSIMKGKHHSEATKKRISEQSRARWADPEYKDRTVKSMIKASNHRPTSAEKALEAILNEVCLNEYKYVGNSNEVVIGGCSPDFVHVDGTKRVMEAHGDFWHSKRRTGRTKEEEEAYKITRYKEFGYECLIIWEHEMKQDKDAVAERIRAFNKGAELEQPQLL